MSKVVEAEGAERLPLIEVRNWSFKKPNVAENAHIWNANYPSQVLKVRGFRTGGNTAKINVRKNGSLTHLATNLDLTTEGSWMDGGPVQNVIYMPGDSMEAQVMETLGSPEEVAVQVETRRLQ